LEVAVDGKHFGEVPTAQMEFGFHELIAHAAKTRSLCAGTIIGSGTASSPDFAEVGSCCIAERRAIETIAGGAPSTGFLRSGDRVTMTGKVGSDAPFGTIDQQVVVRS
jgi:fumarylacetoacetate (FAA) hydrolase